MARLTRTQEELLSGDDIARCPSCSLLLRVVFDEDAVQRMSAPKE